MPEVHYKYRDLAERQEVVKYAEGKGYRMLHDEFDPDWSRGDEPHGIMAFTNEPDPPIPGEQNRDLVAEIDDLRARVEILERE